MTLLNRKKAAEEFKKICMPTSIEENSSQIILNYEKDSDEETFSILLLENDVEARYYMYNDEHTIIGGHGGASPYIPGWQEFICSYLNDFLLKTKEERDNESRTHTPHGPNACY
jgi:hypothetical protein